MNICSVVVHARPNQGTSLQEALCGISGVEVHGGAEQGKLVVTVEGADDDALADTMARFSDLEGVINTVMVYHYCGADENKDIETEEVSQ